MAKSNSTPTTSKDQSKTKTRRVAKKSKTPEKVFHVPDPDIVRCYCCGGTDYVLPKAKGLLGKGYKYCADEDCPGGLMKKYDFSVIGEFRYAIGSLETLQWFLGINGLSTLGGSIEEIEANLFEKLNKATVSFGKFEQGGLHSREQESLKEHRVRIAKNRERDLEKAIRKEIPKEQKQGKTRTQINKMMEKIKQERYPSPAPRHLTEDERELAKWFLDTEWDEAKKNDYYWSYLKSVGWIFFNSYVASGKSALEPALLGLEVIKKKSPEAFQNFMASCQERLGKVEPSTPDNIVYLEERRRHA